MRLGTDSLAFRFSVFRRVTRALSRGEASRRLEDKPAREIESEGAGGKLAHFDVNDTDQECGGGYT